MKKYMLYLSIRVEVESDLESLSETIQEFEKNTEYSFSGSESVLVADVELLRTEIFYP